MTGLENMIFYSRLKKEISKIYEAAVQVKNDFSELAAMISGQTDNSSVYDIMDRADTSHNALAEELDRITAICEVYEDFESKLYEMINDIKLPED